MARSYGIDPGRRVLLGGLAAGLGNIPWPRVAGAQKVGTAAPPYRPADWIAEPPTGFGPLELPGLVSKAEAKGDFASMMQPNRLWPEAAVARNLLTRAYEQFPAHLAGTRVNVRGWQLPRVCVPGHTTNKDHVMPAVRVHQHVPTRYCRIITDATAVIDMTMMKEHHICGITGAIKNIAHGNIDNPHHHHDNQAGPQIALLYHHPSVQSRVRLHIADAFKIVYDKGPLDEDPRMRVPHGAIYASTDAVALDTVARQVIEDERKRRGGMTLERAERAPRYLARAAELGVGVHDPRRHSAAPGGAVKGRGEGRRRTASVVCHRFATLLLIVLFLPACRRRVQQPPPAAPSLVVAPPASATGGPIASGLSQSAALVGTRTKEKRGVVYKSAPATHQEALLHQLDARWARRSDKDRAVDLPLPDHRHWKRVRFFGVEHFTGFTYGDDRHVVTSAFVVKTRPGEVPTTRLCMERFEQDALPKFKRHKGRFTPIVESTGAWRDQPLAIHQSDGRLTVLFSSYEFSAAWAAYPAYSDGCLIYAAVVFWEDEKELAQRVREQWIVKGFGGVGARTATAPARKQ